MTLFDPFSDLTRLRGQLDRMFDQPGQAARPADGGRVWRPAVDVFEDPDALTLRLDLPEIDRSKLDVQLTGEELTVTGERAWRAPEKGSCVHSERPYGQFHRSFRIGFPVQQDAVEAEYREGVLTVRLP